MCMISLILWPCGLLLLSPGIFHILNVRVVMFPRSQVRPADNLITGIAAALATRFDVDICFVKNHLKHANIEEWGRVRRVDSDAGDTMRASSMVAAQDDTRDASYVRVISLVKQLIDSCTNIKHSSMRCLWTSTHARLAVGLNTNSRHSMVNFSTFTWSNSPQHAGISGLINPPPLFWRLSRLAFLITPCHSWNASTSSIIRLKAQFTLLTSRACSVWWVGSATGTGGLLSIGVGRLRERCTLNLKADRDARDRAGATMATTVSA